MLHLNTCLKQLQPQKFKLFWLNLLHDY
jgi:hypothetical protein